MKSLAAALFLALCASSALAAANCEELKSQIAAKIEAKGVKGAVLEVVPADQVKDQKVVGSCAGGTMKITYKKAP
jgi:hypothetical protein